MDIVGYTSLTGDQYTANDSISYEDAGYIGLAPQVAANDTICTTDAFGVLYAQPIDGLTYGWYANKTDTIPTAIGDSFVVPNPGQLEWFLGYEASGPQGFTETYFNANNGGSTGNAFEILPKSSLSIKAFDINVNSTASITVNIEYLLGSVTSGNYLTVGAPWIVHEALTVNGAGSNNPTYVELTTPLVLPGGQVSGLKITTSSGLRYTNGTSVGTPIVTDSKMTIYEGYGISGASGFSPRNWNGRIYYGSDAERCSDSLTPVSVEYYQDTAQADFTFSMGADGRTVYFDATNSVGNVYSWDFGDGTTGMGDSISHTYGDSVGVYAVCLFVDDTVCMTSDYYCDGLVTTVGLEESNLASNVKLYPNPSQGNFNVSFTTAVESDYQIEIVDITGRTVNKKTGETKYGENQVRFDADLPDGVYMVKVIVEGDVSTSRLVIRS